MRRRDLLAGIGSAGVLVSGGAVAAFGIPSPSDSSTGEDDSDGSSGIVGKRRDPLEIETADAPGSEAGTVRVPASDRPTFVDFFATWCAPCKKQMDALVEAHQRVGDEVRFLSVTSESISESELAAWWDDHDGNWTIGLDPTAELTSLYWGTPYPSAVSIDASGRVRWAETGVKTADELVAGIERALEDGDAADGDE
ncbi:TlpA disulfide reductase family protein [Natrinema versiforme]|uniref:TlpA family protein disulfide reductase n=1 Tax=Natrinema versiforme TaxID=88724 RepID=A0A4V1FZJ7_9EURY|nr:TlpA disulfide reductase family protein [Natrinema versiforme]QCS42086.1 TlpA family protein disulfide reductase [Natrinema versiforme]